MESQAGPQASWLVNQNSHSTLQSGRGRRQMGSTRCVCKEAESGGQAGEPQLPLQGGDTGVLDSLRRSLQVGLATTTGRELHSQPAPASPYSK